MQCCTLMMVSLKETKYTQITIPIRKILLLIEVVFESKLSSFRVSVGIGPCQQRLHTFLLRSEHCGKHALS